MFSSSSSSSLSFADALYATVRGPCPDAGACLVCHASTAAPFASLGCSCSQSDPGHRQACHKQIHLKCVLEGSRWTNVGRLSMATTSTALVYDCPDHHEEPLFCICSRPMNDEVMFQCDECLNWFHQGCLISDVSMYEDENWVCSRCKIIVAHNDPEELRDLRERKQINHIKDVRATAIQAASDAFLHIKYMGDNLTVTIDSALASASGSGPGSFAALQQQHSRLPLFKIHDAIASLTKAIEEYRAGDRPISKVAGADTFRFLTETRQKLDKVLASYAVIAATALDVAKNANRLFSNSSSDPFDGRLVSRLQPLIESAEKTSREFEDSPCSSEDDVAFLCFLDALRWISSFCEAMRGVRAREDSAAKVQAIDDALRGSASITHRFSDLEGNRGAKASRSNGGAPIFSPTMSVYRGALTGLSWVTKAAKRFAISARSVDSFGAAASASAAADASGGAGRQLNKSKTMRGYNLNAHRADVGTELGQETSARLAGVVLQKRGGGSSEGDGGGDAMGGGKPCTAAEARLMELFEAKEASLLRREEDRLALNKMITKNKSLVNPTSVPATARLPAPLPVPIPVAPPAAAPAAAAAAATAAAAKKRVTQDGADAEAKAPAPAGKQPAARPATAAAAPAAATTATATAAAAAAAAAASGSDSPFDAASALAALASLSGGSSDSAAEAPSAAAADDPTSIFDVPEVSKIRKRARQDDDGGVMEVVESDPLTDGSEVFSRTGTGSLVLEAPWDPRTAEDSAVIPLPDFGIIYDEDDAHLREKQTLVLLVKLPEGAKQWAVNICPANHLDHHNVLLHFNPRYAAGKTADRKELVLNDREGTWGPAFKDRIRPDARTKALLASTVELAIQIRKEGFAIFANQQCLGLFPHRRPVTSGQPLVLTLPLKDDMAQRLDGQVVKAWWGRVPHSAYYVPGDLQALDQAAKWAEVTTGMMGRPARARSVVVTGLPLQTSPKELQEVEEALRSVFAVREIEPEAISVVPGRGVAYARLETAEQQRDAIKSLQRIKIEAEGQKWTLRMTEATW